MPERENFLTRKVKGVVDKGAELSKKFDKIGIIAGLGIFVVSSTVGAAIIIGSALTIIPAEKMQRWVKKGRR